jgi:hypothetical protein
MHISMPIEIDTKTRSLLRTDTYVTTALAAEGAWGELILRGAIRVEWLPSNVART